MTARVEHIACAHGPLTAAEIAQRLRTGARTKVSAMLSKLAKRGLVARHTAGAENRLEYGAPGSRPRLAPIARARLYGAPEPSPMVTAWLAWLCSPPVRL